MPNEKEIFVYENWSRDIPMLLGKMYVQYSRGREQVSFEYSNEWLKNNKDSYMLDPELYFYSGRQYPISKSIFGLFSDSSPDRWGRLLMKRREAILAKKENRKPNVLTDTDYLLGVFDESRMGALRFALEENGPFLSHDKELSTPPRVKLRTLENASLSFEMDESGYQEQWLRQLLAPGSSLGGARPKATVLAPDGSLWIAKFPSKNDEFNIGAWEKVTHELARLCGLDVPESKSEAFSSYGSTFIVKRFDRCGSKRIHFSSAMSLLGKSDGASGTDGSSYLDIVSFIRANGAAPAKDLSELWKRIVFSMAVSNTDDHLRNHGFILCEKGWRLSPLYDVNPTPYGNTLSLNVDWNDNSISLELALSCANYFGLAHQEAIKESENIIQIVKDNWTQLAKQYGLNRGAIEYMRPAFEFCYR